jgi:hypothetical protein
MPPTRNDNRCFLWEGERARETIGLRDTAINHCMQITPPPPQPPGISTEGTGMVQARAESTSIPIHRVAFQLPRAKLSPRRLAVWIGIVEYDWPLHNLGKIRHLKLISEVAYAVPCSCLAFRSTSPEALSGTRFEPLDDDIITLTPDDLNYLTDGTVRAIIAEGLSLQLLQLVYQAEIKLNVLQRDESYVTI